MIINPYLFILLLFPGNIEREHRDLCLTVSEVSERKVQKWKTLEVTATAYNSLAGQGQGNPSITAWGDTLRPGMKSIAVSRDLLKKGLTYGTLVQIEGLEGNYIVNDKMHRRWRNKIDIYMGIDREKALEWGRRKVEICFPVQSTSK